MCIWNFLRKHLICNCFTVKGSAWIRVDKSAHASIVHTIHTTFKMQEIPCLRTSVNWHLFFLFWQFLISKTDKSTWFHFFFQTEQDSRYKFTSPDWVNGCVILDSWFHVLSLCTLSFRSKFYAYTIWSQIFIFLTEASILTFVFFCRVNFVTKGSLNKARMIWTSIILYYADVFQFIYDLMSEKFFLLHRTCDPLGRAVCSPVCLSPQKGNIKRGIEQV